MPHQDKSLNSLGSGETNMDDVFKYTVLFIHL